MLIPARKVLPSPLWKPQPPWPIFAWWLGPPLAVLLAVLWLWKMLAPLMAVAGRGTEGPGRGNHQDPAPLWLGQVCAQRAPPSQRLKGCLVPDGKAPAVSEPGPSRVLSPGLI